MYKMIIKKGYDEITFSVVRLNNELINTIDSLLSTAEDDIEVVLKKSKETKERE